MLRRNLTDRLLDALADTPVVLVHGARQTGKTTLVRAVAERWHPARYLTLDDPLVLAAAQSDPHGFVAGLEGDVVLDEVQRAPGLGLAIKAAVDRLRTPGRFLLTGSANVLQVPRLADSLVGRMEVLTLGPLSQGEIEGRCERFVDVLFGPGPPRWTPPRDPERPLVDLLLAGGYPEALARRDAARRRAWFASYLDTLLQRDVRDLANIEGLTSLPRLLALLAARCGALLNASEIGRSVGLPQTTLKRYLALLETTFLLHTLPPWSGNLGLRLVRSPKLYLGDTGLLLYLLSMDRDRLLADPITFGRVLENLVVVELHKQSSWSQASPRLFHYRTQAGVEVDLMLEGPGGRLVGIEVKAAATIHPGDLKGLRHLAERFGERFHRGVLLHGGTETVALGPKLLALPIRAVWEIGDGGGEGPT